MDPAISVARRPAVSLMWARVEAVVATAALVLAMLFLAWVGLAYAERGLSSADDAFLALGAKGFALGPGYATPQSDGHFLWFDPGISVGPPMILPLALLIRLFGASDILPGATALGLFLAQIGGVGLILSRRTTWAATTAYMFMLLVVLLVATNRYWEFGAFLGEPVTFGFLLLGAACLTVGTSPRWVAAGAMFLSLAILTKQIALFGAAGIVAAWIVVLVTDRLNRRAIIHRLSVMLLVGASLQVAFELYKAATVGVDQYLAVTGRFLFYSSAEISTAVEPGKRIDTLASVLERSYLPVIVFVAVVAVSMVLLFIAYRRLDRSNVAVRLAALSGAGAAVHLLYWVALSSMRDRYLWLAVGLLCAAVATPVLALPARMRTVAVAVVAALFVLSGGYQQLVSLQGYLNASPDHAERTAVARTLDAAPDVPYAAQNWQSVFDVTYLKSSPAVGRYEPSVVELRGQEFIAIVNTTFTNPSGRFATTVTATCTPEQTAVKKVASYRCGSAFWSRYTAP
jgi:hypothetical protein